MGFFKDLKAMAKVTKDIISTGKASFKACEAMDALIERAGSVENISTESRNAINAVEELREYEGDDREEKLEAAQVNALEAFQKDAALTAQFKEECKAAVQNYKDVNNSIYDKVGNTLAQYAENDEQREIIDNAIKAEKKK